MNNYCIILAGGTGRRLWPYSTTDRPKQFLDFFGTGRTLLQMTFDRFCRLMPPDHIFISTHADYVSMVAEQLPELPAENIVEEDIRLSTAPAALLATRRIMAHDAEACIVCTPADQVILNEENFCSEVESALQRLRVTAANRFMALAVQATHPYTSYGYIQKGEAITTEVFHVKTFTEKPDREFAEMFVQSDEFLWNTGLFLWQAPTLESLADELQEEVAAVQLDGLLLDKHRHQVLVQECHFGWTDVGCWPRMQEVSHKDVDGNAIVGHAPHIMLEGCSDNTITLQPDVQAIIKNLSGYLVAYHNHTLVIVPNDDTTDLKHFQLKLNP